jgi:CheY-like chemotaxis protein
MDLRIVRLSDIVSEIAALLRPTIGEAVRLSIAEVDETLRVETDPAELTHAVINLAVNARDAMPEGGEISIAVEPRSLAAGAVPGLAAGEYAEIAVRDRGIGMDEATIARIFDPFFTTKGLSGGTGLGLPMVYGFAQQSRGAITVSTTPGAGSTFRLYLPLTRAALATLPAANGEAPRAQGETILLVEDNPAILRLTSAALEQLGYAVLTADNGISALEVEQSHDGAIDLLLTDVVMPSLGGIELAEILCGGRPTLKAMFISGYPAGSDMQPLPIPAGKLLLRKPFHFDELARAVRASLMPSQEAA